MYWSWSKNFDHMVKWSKDRRRLTPSPQITICFIQGFNPSQSMADLPFAMLDYETINSPEEGEIFDFSENEFNDFVSFSVFVHTLFRN